MGIGAAGGFGAFLAEVSAAVSEAVAAIGVEAGAAGTATAAGVEGAGLVGGAGIAASEAAAGTGAATALGGGLAAGIGDAAVGATTGAAFGATESAVTGGNPATGALTGGLTGGAVGGFGGAASDLFGSSIAGNAFVGAGSGALGAGITGGDPLTGTLGGAASGGFTGALASGGDLSSSGIAGGGGTSASGSAAPPGTTGDFQFGQETLPTGGAAGQTTSLSGDIGSIIGGGGASGAVDGFGGAPPAGAPLDPTAATDLTANLALGESGGTANIGFVEGAPRPDITGQGNEPFGTGAGGTQVANALPGISVPGAAQPLAAPSGGLAAGAVNDLPGAPPGGTPAIAGGGPVGAEGGTFTTGTPPAAPGPTSALGKFLAEPGFDKGFDALGANANWLVPAATLGYTALNAHAGLSGVPGYTQLNTTANSLNSQGQQLQSYLNTGTLPPGVQQSLTTAGKSLKASIRSQYASKGMSGSSAEMSDLARVDQTIVSSGVDIATRLLAQGVSEQGLSAQLYQSILSANLQSDSQLGTALGTLAASAARPTVNLQVAR